MLGEPLTRTAAQGEAEVMNDGIETHRPTCERAQSRCGQPLGEDLPAAASGHAAEAAAPQPDAH